MFFTNGYIRQSDILNIPRVHHGFSTRLGGISTAEHLKSMNVGFFRGDSDETVIENMKILCRMAGVSEKIVFRPQYHTTNVVIVGEKETDEKFAEKQPECDGFVTDTADVTLLVRIADCTPILLAGEKEDGSPVVSAVHAGWRGTVGGIAANAVGIMRSLGADNIKAAIGPCIHSCCYEVGEDFICSVSSLRGKAFAEKHIENKGGKYFADIAGMNKDILLSCGVCDIDISPECTACSPDIFHSHRATKGHRGTMGAVISITGGKV